VNKPQRFMVGRIASLREQLTHLRDRVTLCRISFDRHPSGHNEIELHRAEQALDDFCRAHPTVR
jgi:hypothetical protein